MFDFSPSRWLPRGRAIASQLGRYAVAGLALTLGNAASYWALTDLGGVAPMASLALTSSVFLVVGYVTHARFTFRSGNDDDHWSVRAVRFLLVRLLGLGLNQLFVLLLVERLGGPTWWPIIPMVFVTPLIIFGLLRTFVYRSVDPAERR
ncbi:GtrA family protein [uncultured Sphingomonas sp.]|uniref:GtrA family protein n=1 Tax=uncultured Sphingomonas sp. TaxID=158754 RepID=UPI0035CC0E88